MSARNSWFLNSAILLLYYTCGGIEYISALPTGVRILHTLTHGFNIPPFRPPPYSIRFDGVNGDYMAGQVERHPWERHQFRHRNEYGPHKDFVIAQPKFHSSEEFNINSVGNTPPFLLNPAAGPFEGHRVNVALTQDSIIVKHPWHNLQNQHDRRHHHRWHDCQRPIGSDPDLNGENVQGTGYEAASFGQNAIFENTDNGIRKWDNNGPPRRVGGEPKEDTVIDITPTTPTTTRAAPPTTTESAERTVEITEPMTRTYEKTTANNSGAISTTTTIEITEPTTKKYETTTVNNSGAISTTGATVTAAPTESTFAIDIRSGFA
ncbi:uncharacterized protein LOC120775893 [Bactrocera tryoni]|uniref:uncharacterized protein LOC120775893 n=1 Tax=Bactrocera tryoni TaxID=59916 RepID=UPI001A988907|nr:uncharacterized protein LOC120775893 [Bactrocera tryoni]